MRTLIENFNFSDIVLFLFVAFVILLPLIVWWPIALGYKKRAKEKLSELFSLVDATTYTLEQLYVNGVLSVSFLGQYKTYKVKCYYTVYKNDFSFRKGHYVHIIFDTKVTKSKIPFFKFFTQYPKVYKNYVFDGKKIYLSGYDLGENSIPKERAVELLDDMIKACELVENPDFRVHAP